MAKSPKTKVRDAGRSSLQGYDGGRGSETTTPGSTVVADSKGGTGDRGGDGDPKHHPRAKPLV